MIKDDTINKLIDEKLLADNALRDSNHVSSGKLSASMLSDPLQWQILKTLKAPTKPFDAYTLRKFARGREVENWFVRQVPAIVTQEFVEYKNTIGFIDLILEDPKSKFYIPHEVKSVTNAKFKRISDMGEPDDGHLLQAGFYGLAKGSSYFAIDYIASDDLRVLTWIFNTESIEKRIEKIIKDYHRAWEAQEVPVFVPNYSWQKNKEYNKYPDWADLNEQEIKEKMKRLDIKFS